MCDNRTSALQSLAILTDLLFSKGNLPLLPKCPLPCEQTVFDVKLFNFHLDNYLGKGEESAEDIKKSAIIFTVGYETFAVHEHVETLVYDAGNFLTQVGGNLGDNLRELFFIGTEALAILISQGYFSDKCFKPSLIFKGETFSQAGEQTRIFFHLFYPPLPVTTVAHP